MSRRGDSTPVGIDIGAGAVTVLAAATLAGLAFSPSETIAREAVVALAVLAFAVATADPAAVAVITGCAFALVNGFLVNGGGELTWHDKADIHLITALIGSAAIGLLLGWVRRREHLKGKETHGA